MKKKPTKGKKWLLAMAKAVAMELKRRAEGTRLSIRLPSRTPQTNTAGWAATIGKLGKKGPYLEVWLDRFTGHDERKLWACFHSEDRRQLMNITKKVSEKLVPIRVLTHADTDDTQYIDLEKKLPLSHFNRPILEKYSEGSTFYGLYEGSEGLFLKHAVAFFDSVARVLPNAKQADESLDVYPKHENRRHVRSHLVRERSLLLATNRKAKDGYRCQVCDFRFVSLYGNLGTEFAEAHHMVPLSKLKENVKTKIDDLTTVCANCHRMLHRMDGERDDVKKLRAVVRKRLGKQK